MPIGGIAALVSTGSSYHAMGKWRIDPTSEAPAFSSSGTGPAIARVAGNKDFTGQVEAYGHTPPVIPGTGFTFNGSMDGTNGATGAAMCAGCSIQIRQETGEPIKHILSFEGNGALTLGAAVGAADAVVQTPFPSTGLLFKYDPIGAGAEVTLDDVRQVDLGITKQLHAYASSSTAGVKKRIAGVLDAEVSVQMYVTDPADIPTRGEMSALKVYVTDTLFWLLEYAICTDISGIEVDRETGAIVGCTVKWMYSSVAVIAGTATAGAITTPAGVDWFP